ncbi:MFS transporter [Anaerocolumna xylanovorans]|uniref:Predicted arabinose efflux permease, MFS family n=1 Tax=Anaerocolumna xylanovorans DSM 12503 TaxID=1121345 RepID=A0A1M7Y0X9_9FIRM|nr:MFS transporter [Anaerocolumna xylanovorans]SHO45333.1 Predicted arabinose efflux permease, MFS family [Anaerocolumna xylanovorans DSM 12503]
MKQQSKSEPLWTKNFILLLASAVFMYIATFMFTPTLPLFARSIGAVDPSVGGFVILVYTVGSFVPRVIWGNMADRRGRKPVFLIGVIIMAAAAPFLGLFVSLSGILIIRLIQGIGFSASSTSGSTMAADLVPASRMTEGIGLYTLANTIGMALGPDLGLNILRQYGARWLFGASIVSGVVSLGLGMLLNYEKKRGAIQSEPGYVRNAMPEAESTESVKLSSKHGKLIEKSVLTTSLVAFFAVMPYGAIMAYIASYGIDRGVGNIGLYFSVYALSLFLVRLVIGRLSDRHGITMVIIPGSALMFGGLVVLHQANSLAVFLISAILFGLGFGVVFPLLQAIAYMFCPENRRGVASATLFTTTDLAYGLGAVIIGFGIKYLGYATAFAGLSIFIVISIIFYIILLYPQLKSSGNKQADLYRKNVVKEKTL